MHYTTVSTKDGNKLSNEIMNLFQILLLQQNAIHEYSSCFNTSDEKSDECFDDLCDSDKLLCEHLNGVDW